MQAYPFSIQYIRLTMFICSTFSLLIAIAAACGKPEHGNLPPKTAITNVKVFDGAKFTRETTVVIVGDKISNANSAGATVVDGK
jgi:hypothetical protein